VGLSENGRFLVDTSTGLAQRVYIDGGTVAVKNDGNPLSVNVANSTLSVVVTNTLVNPAIVSVATGSINITQDSLSPAIRVTGGGGGGGVGVSTCATTVSGQVPVPFPGLGVAVYPADATRCQGSFCNASNSESVWLGPLGVTILTGIELTAGSCYSPDGPNIEVGAIYGVSTATARVEYIYHKP